MGLLGHLTALGVTGAALGTTFAGFGGENLIGESPGEDNWHHEGLTRQAAVAAGWNTKAENALAFHADFLDSYLYNPLWWFDVRNGGGPDRIPVVMSSQEDLKALHFDDLVHPESVRATWRRYLSGTVAGLIWLGHAESGPPERRISMAQNLVGSSLHAIQDFYSHSNWIDDQQLRGSTWFEVDPDTRDCLSLWTGTYETPHHLGIKPHGAYNIACSVIKRFGSVGESLMNIVCHGASPLANSQLCRSFRQCAETQSPDPPKFELPKDIKDKIGDVEIDLPKEVIWVEPGINVDSRWMAPIGTAVRDLPIAPQDAFDAAYRLAYRSSCQWLHIIEHVMGAPEVDLAPFWESVKEEGVDRNMYLTPREPWEDFSQIPYRFISAGQYPPLQGHDDTNDWYLRLLIRTSSDVFSGTDADIVPIVNGDPFPVLDHGVQPDPASIGQVPSRALPQTLMGRNDFEAGDIAAYMVGPVTEPPHTLALRNDARDFEGTVKAAADALWRELSYAFDAAVEFLKGLWGYQADFVDEAHHSIPATILEGLSPGARETFNLHFYGGSEGQYSISGYVEGTSETGRYENGVAWRRYEVSFDRLTCVRQSDVDQVWSLGDDEPFVLGLVIPHGGRQQMISWRTAPYSGVRSGTTVTINQPPLVVEIPQRYGFISVACALWESDNETPNDRDLLLAEFSRDIGSEIVLAEDSFVEVLGESVASGWRLESVEAVAFRRAPTVEVRSYPPRTFNQWVEGGHQVEWTLSELGHWQVEVPDTIRCDCQPCTAEVRLPSAEVDITELDYRRKPGDRQKHPEDLGREVPVDLAEFDPRCRQPTDTDPGEVDETPPAPRPKDGC
jgi:hypothetical protein